MRFNEDNKVEWWTITKPQARTFVIFLRIERFRHWLDIWFGYLLMLFGARELWKSEIHRHKDDISTIDNLICEVQHWHKLNNKEGKK